MSDLVPLFAIFFIFGAPIAAFVISRVLAHQERMEMLRRGIVPPPNPRDLRRGMQVAFVGLALLIGLGFIGYHGDGTFSPGPWLLGGLIPLFVGIAQIIGAVLSGASFGPASPGRRFGTSGDTQTMPPPAGTAGSAMPPGPTYGGWRPGPTPEIEKPASPPDYRA